MNNRIALSVFLAMIAGSLAVTDPEGKCKPNDHDCGDGRCLPSSFVCNGFFDCGNGNDEFDCKLKPKAEVLVADSSPASSISTMADDTLSHFPAEDIPFGDEAEAPTFPLELER